MIHKIAIRDLNTFANQLPKDSPVREDIHAQVLLSVEVGVSHILLNDEKLFDKLLLHRITAAKILKRDPKKTKRTTVNQTPYISVQEYILRRKGK